MAFDIMDFVVAVIAIGVGIYILKVMGYIKTGKAGASYAQRGGQSRAGRMYNPTASAPAVTHTAPTRPSPGVPATPIQTPRIQNNVGPTQPTSFSYAKGIGGRSFST